MTFTARFLVLVLLVHGLIPECYSALGFFQTLKDCMDKEFNGVHRKNCLSDTDCETVKFLSILRTCFAHSFDMLYQDSSNYRMGDHDTNQLVHCAIDQCIDGIRQYEDLQEKQENEPLSETAEYFYHCLLAVRECVPHWRSHGEL
ncbi:hypothetical protein GN956_G10801 [Arapaima gigas]